MVITKIFTQIKTFILDTLFPIACLNCGQDDVWFCDECLVNFKFLSFQVCPQCEREITENGKLCRTCKISSAGLDGLLIASGYQENNVAKLVHILKYNFVSDLHIPLGKILSKIIWQNSLPLPDAIIPVPLHKRRLRFRGFNQSELLAKYLSQNLTPGMEIPVFSDTLIRKKYTPPQMKIKKYSDRQKNITDAFEINSSADCPLLGGQSALCGKTILLVDDIATTGSTLLECAKTLKQNGAKKVFGAVIARQSFK